MVPRQPKCTGGVLGVQCGTNPNLRPCTTMVHSQPQCTIVVPMSAAIRGHRSMAPLPGPVTCRQGSLPSRQDGLPAGAFSGVPPDCLILGGGKRGLPPYVMWA